MTGWIEKTINPPGIRKPNRRALFGTIGEIGGKVKADALKAFNARFPYLADSAKLEEHGAALLVPRLLGDTEKEYRDRVTAASFFLTRAGERSYIAGQLDAHFGGRYTVLDEFLNVFVKVRDLADADRRWLLQFLDGLVNPSVKLSVAEWFTFIDRVMASGVLSARAGLPLGDTFGSSGAKLDGRVKLDRHTLNPEHQVRPKLDGRWLLNAALNLSGSPPAFPASDYPRMPVKLCAGILDCCGVKTKTGLGDSYRARVKLNGVAKLDGTESLSGFGMMNGRVLMMLRGGFQSVADMDGAVVINAAARLGGTFGASVRKLDGTLKLNGKKKIAGEIAEKNLFAAKAGHCETFSARQKLNGANRLNGYEKLSGFGKLSGRFNTGIRYCRRLDGRFRLDGSIRMNSGILIPA